MESDYKYLRKRISELDSMQLRIQFFRPDEGIRVYHISRYEILKLAQEADAFYKIGRACLIDKQKFEEYLEKFKVR